MPGYEGSLFDANGPAQFATQVHGIADAMDDINQKATAFFQTTQEGIDNLSQSLNDFQSASGGFSPGGGGGRGGGSGWTVPSGINSGGTGGQRGNTVGNGGSGNRPPDFQSMTGDAPNGGEGAGQLTTRQMVTRGAEAGVGVATGAARNYVAQTEAPSIQQQLSAVQLDLSTGKSIGYTMGGIARSRYLATSQADLALGIAATQNLYGTALVGAPAGSAMAGNAQTLGTAFNAIEMVNPTVGLTGAAQAMSGMITPQSLRTQMAFLGGTTIRNNQGQYQSPETIVNRIMQLYPQLKTMDDASFEQTLTSGNLYQDIMAMTGGDPTMLSTIQNYLRAARRQGGALPANMTTKQSQQLGLTSPAAVSQLQKQSAQGHMQAATAQGQDQALTDFNKAMTDFYNAVNSVFGAAPGVAYGAGFGAKGLSMGGGLVGTAMGFLTNPLGSIEGLFGGGGGGGGGGGLLGGLLGGGGGGGGGGLGGGINPLELAGAFFGVKGLSKLIGGLGSRLGGTAASAARAAGADVAGAGGVAGGVVDATSTVLGDVGSMTAGGIAAGGTEAGAATAGALAGSAAVAAPLAAVAAGAVYDWHKILQNDQNFDWQKQGLTPTVGLGGFAPGNGNITLPPPTTGTNWDFLQAYLPGASTTASTTATTSSSTTGGTGGTGGAGALPTGQHKTLIDQSLKLAGLAVDPANEAAVNTIVTYESSWNPSAVNRTDSNAKAGHPSQGLMQTIPSTFAAYAVPPYNKNILDPLSNLIAGERYAAHTYGNLLNVPGVKAIAAGRKYQGYERGTYEVSKTELALLHKGERVVPAAENSVMSRWNKGNGPSTTHLHFHMAPGAITVSMPSSDAKTAQRAGAAVADAMIAELAKS